MTLGAKGGIRVLGGPHCVLCLAGSRVVQERPPVALPPFPILVINHKMVAAALVSAPVAARVASSRQLRGQALKAVPVRARQQINTVCRAAVSGMHVPGLPGPGAVGGRHPQCG